MVVVLNRGRVMETNKAIVIVGKDKPSPICPLLFAKK